MILPLASLALCASALQDPSGCLVSGRLLLPDGTPAEGAVVALHGWPANQARAERHGVPADWRDPGAVRTDGTGRFELTLDPPPAFQFTLDASLPGRPVLSWRWGSLLPGTPLQLGDVAFEPSCYVVGHIQSHRGEILVDGWSVQAAGHGQLPPGRAQARSSSSPDPSTGEFRLGPLPPGPVRLAARSTQHTETLDLVCEATPEQTTNVVLTYTGAALESRIVVTTASRTFPFHDLEAGPGEPPGETHLWLLDSDGKLLERARRVAGRAQDWEFTHVPEGEHTIELRDPRYEARRIEHAEAGGSYGLPLVGSAQLELDVAGIDGAPLEAYGLWVGFHDSGWSPNRFQVRPLGSPAEPLVGGLIPGKLWLEVHAPNGHVLTHELGEVASAETRKVSLQLTERRPLRCRLLLPSGAPAPACEVEFTPGRQAGLSDGSEVSVGTPSGMQTISGALGRIASDAEGRLEIPNLAPGDWTLRAFASSYAWTTQVVAWKGDEQEVEIVLPAVGTLEGQVTSTAELAPERLRIVFEPRWHPRLETFLSMGPPLLTPVDAEGRFRMEGLPLGQVQLSVHKDLQGSFIDPRQSQLVTMRVPVTAGSNRWDCDLEAHLPGTVKLELRLDGSPLPDAKVHLIAASSLQRSLRSKAAVAPFGANQTTDSSGSATFRGVAPKGDYLLFVSDPKGQWTTCIAPSLAVPGNRTTAASAALEIVERRVQIVDEQGAPLPQLDFAWTSAGVRLPTMQTTTDGRGYAVLRLPAGTWACSRLSTPKQGKTFDWSAGTAPLVLSL